MKGWMETRDVRFFRGMATMMCAFLVLSTAAVVEAGTSRDFAQEIADVSQCLGGPDVVPAPSGDLDAAMCLGMFDYDDDGDVDLGDYEVYLKSASPDEEPRIEIGEATYTDHSFYPYADGGTIELHSGFQGGTHVFLAIRGFNFPPDVAISFYRSGEAVEPIPVSETISLEHIFLSPQQPFSNIAFPNIGVGASQTQRFQLITLLPPGTGDYHDIDLTIIAETFNHEPIVEAEVTLRLTLVPFE